MIQARATTGASSLAPNFSSSRRSPPESRHPQQKISQSCPRVSNRHDQPQLLCKNRHCLHQPQCIIQRFRLCQLPKPHTLCTQSCHLMQRFQFRITLALRTPNTRFPIMTYLLSRPCIHRCPPTCTLRPRFPDMSKQEAAPRLPWLETQRRQYLDLISAGLHPWTTVATFLHSNPL